MIVGPVYKLCGRNYERHPLYKNSSNQSIDFWGPCALVSLYGLVLWLGRVRGNKLYFLSSYMIKMLHGYILSGQSEEYLII